MTKDNNICDISVCEWWKHNSTCGRCERNCKNFDRMFCKINSLLPCYHINECDYKLRIKAEHQLKLVNQDNDALSRYCDKLEKIIEEQRNKIAQLTNMQDKKVILE